MPEVACHIVGYNAFEAYKLIWQLFALNLVTFGAIGGVALIVHGLIKGRKTRRPYHV